MEIDSVFVRHRSWLGFCMGVENYLSLVLGSKLTWFLWLIEINFISTLGSRLNWFQCWGRNRLDFCVWIEVGLVLVV